ncbi:unnamed protein product [Blumeria hordei]|uniref:25S rRNA adenine-N(1) methyltransferase n=2 Tax=Blumeria hordei TaxID=2867405 RepID=A0A383UXZ4_BLUHO|nr:nucleolar protein [Blumeria hordei DH14]SZF04250.1 unnamed protein product [Blumeria hordei]
MRKRRLKRLKDLHQGRPPIAKYSPTISSKATRAIIRRHHTLQKQRNKSLAEGDIANADDLMTQIEHDGGIEMYQRASLLGQSRERGGDSSKVMLNWLQPLFSKLDVSKSTSKVRILEIGALSDSNACSNSKLFEVERIDLNSQSENIKQQDFMERPTPRQDNEKFDIISLSLVLNFVPDAAGRGSMLMRISTFLRTSKNLDTEQAIFPCLFLVLPASCITNSRYMDEARLDEIMTNLGYVCVHKKLSKKLVYYLWHLRTPNPAPNTFRKKEVRSGKTRNNFSIVINL